MLAGAGFAEIVMIPLLTLQGCTEAVAINAQSSGLPVGSRYLFAGDGRLVAQIGDAPAPAELRRGPSSPTTILWTSTSTCELPRNCI